MANETSIGNSTGDIPEVQPVFFLMHWDDQTITTIPASCVVQPRKDYKDYAKGDYVTSKCPGWRGLHKGTIAEVGCKYI